jgi:hypothetical protein
LGFWYTIKLMTSTVARSYGRTFCNFSTSWVVWSILQQFFDISSLHSCFVSRYVLQINFQNTWNNVKCYLCSKFLFAQTCFRILILIQYLKSKFLFLANIPPFYVMIYNSKTWICILNTLLDSNLLKFLNRIWADRNLEH